MWANIEFIDTIGTDHAPHTKAEKDEANRLNPEGKTGKDDKKSFGVPGLEAMLPLMLRAVEDGKLTPQQLVYKTSSRPRELIGLPKDSASSIRVSMEQYEFSEEDVKSKCGWSPYIGQEVVGRVVQVDLHGKVVYRNGEFVEAPQGQVLKAA
jgi:dihydroorotase-like cyclic amidohydrolase